MQESTARTDIDDESTEKVASPETLSVWGLAWPSILANILYASVGVVALKAVGNLGTDAVAAVGTGGRIFFCHSIHYDGNFYWYHCFGCKSLWRKTISRG